MKKKIQSNPAVSVSVTLLRGAAVSGAAVWPLKTGSSREQGLTLAEDVPSLSYTALGLPWKTL